MRINYVIAIWTGARHLSRIDKNGHYLFAHLDQLGKLAKSLSQITVGYPYYETEPPRFRIQLNRLPKEIDGIPLSVVPMINSGKSYGQLSRIYGATRGQFDYYIFMEDDYVPFLDNFDTLLADLIQRDPDCGYLCSVYGEEKNEPSGAAVSTGIIRAKALEAVWEKFGCIPHIPLGPINEQAVFSQAFLQTGWKIKDYLQDYSSPYLSKEETQDVIVIYGDPTNKHILGPIQMLDEQSLAFPRRFYKSGIWPFN